MRRELSASRLTSVPRAAKIGTGTDAAAGRRAVRWVRHHLERNMDSFELFLYGALAAGGVGLAAAVVTLGSAVRDDRY